MQSTKLPPPTISLPAPSRTLAAERVRPGIVLSAATFWASTLVMMLVGFGWRAWNASGTAMWTDEVLTAHRVEGSLQQALDSLSSVGNQAPLYYLMLRILPHNNELLLRFPSMLCGMLGLALMMRLFIELYHDRHVALWAGALMAANPLHVILSRTARYYSLLFVLTLVITLCFVAILRGRASRRVWIVFGVCSLLAYMTHYSALAMPAAQFLVLALSQRRNRPLLRQWFVVQVLAGLPFVLWSAAMLMGGMPDAYHYNYPPHVPSLDDPPVTMMNLLLGYADSGVLWALPGVLAASLALAAGGIYVARRVKSQPEYLYWIVLALVPLVTLFSLSLLLGVQYRDRYLLITAPAWLVIFFSARHTVAWQTLQTILVLAVLTSLALTAELFRTEAYERTDWRDAADYVADNFQPGDKLIFERELFRNAFSRYFEGDPAIIEGSYILLNAPNAATIAYEEDAQRIWAVYRIHNEDFHRQGWERGVDPFTSGIAPLSDWLIAHRHKVIYQKPFRGGVVFLLSGVPPLADSQ